MGDIEIWYSSSRHPLPHVLVLNCVRTKYETDPSFLNVHCTLSINRLQSQIQIFRYKIVRIGLAKKVRSSSFLVRFVFMMHRSFVMHNNVLECNTALNSTTGMLSHKYCSTAFSRISSGHLNFHSSVYLPFLSFLSPFLSPSPLL